MISPERINNQNTFHECANQIETELLKLLLPWLNQKIMTIKGEKTAKFRQQYDNFVELRNLNQTGSGHWFTLFVRYNSLILSVRDEKMCLSVEVYVGRCNDQGILIELRESVPLKTDYVFSEVENAFKTARELQDKARILFNSVSVFT